MDEESLLIALIVALAAFIWVFIQTWWYLRHQGSEGDEYKENGPATLGQWAGPGIIEQAVRL